MEERHEPREQRQQLLILCHGRDRVGLLVMQNACTALDFAHIRYDVLDLARQSAWPQLAKYASLMICTDQLLAIDPVHIRRVKEYVLSGGGLHFAVRCWHPSLHELLGFSELPTKAPPIHVTQGLEFVVEIAPATHGLRVENAEWIITHERFDIAAGALDKGCRVLATDLEGRPIAWRRHCGDGRLIFWNTEILFLRVLRGFLLQTMLDTMGTAVAAVAGFAMIHVDDWPLPISHARPKPVAAEYPDLDQSGFIFGPWRDDMMDLRHRFGLCYSWYTVIDYGDLNTQPAVSLGADGSDGLVERFGRAGPPVQGDEYGFHGYNHIAVTSDGWPCVATFRARILRARERWRAVVPAPLPTSWVPAMNQYNADHAAVVKQIFPEITAVCSTHVDGDPSFGQYREFGPEPWCQTLTCLPRSTHGFFMSPKQRMMLLSQIHSMGAWTHFLHPDDVLDLPAEEPGHAFTRNPASLFWRARDKSGRPGLYHEFENWISLVREVFPWIEFVTTSQAEARYHRHVNNSCDVVIGPGMITISTKHDGIFRIKTEVGIVLHPEVGATLSDTREVDDGNISVIRCVSGTSRIRLAKSNA